MVKPIDVNKIKRAKTKAEMVHLLEVELVPIPEKEEQSIFKTIGDRLPFIILQRGKKVLKALAGRKGMPSLLKAILNIGASGISYAANRFSVKQK